MSCPLLTLRGGGSAAHTLACRRTKAYADSDAPAAAKAIEYQAPHSKRRRFVVSGGQCPRHVPRSLVTFG